VPAFRRLVATRRVRFPGKEARGKRRKSYEIQNHNRLLANYPGAIGVKNGYTVKARWSVVGAATRRGHTYLVAALRCGEGSWRPTAALLDWAFAHGAQARPIGRLVNRGEIPATAPSATPAPSASRTPARTPPAVQAEAAPAAPTAQAAPARPGDPPRTDRRGARLAVSGVLVLAALAVLLSARARRLRRRARRRGPRAPRPRP